MRFQNPKVLFERLNEYPDDTDNVNALVKMVEKGTPELAVYYKKFHHECYESLLTLFLRDTDKMQLLGNLAIGQVLARHGIFNAGITISNELITGLAADPLCILVLSKNINTNITFEIFLTRLRQVLLDMFPKQIEVLDIVRPLLAALNHQCFNNEYIFDITEAEKCRMPALESKIADALEAESVESLEKVLLLWGLYRPFSELSVFSQLAKLPASLFSEEVKTVIERTVQEHCEELEIKKTVVTFGQIENSTSRAVQAQYEKNPYPRWISLSGPYVTVEEQIREQGPNFHWPSRFCEGPMQILVAGCGSGRLPLRVASGNPNANILAIDLSSASLAYGIRMSKRYSIQNITFMQGDVLNLPELDRKFHHIVCVGVLHHIQDHLSAWGTLAKILRSKGTMHIGVYSKASRLIISYLRSVIQLEQIDASPAGIRQFRQRLLTDPVFADVVTTLSRTLDFFSLSTVRDLLFHVQEHHYTIAEIESIAGKLGLDLLGIKLPLSLQNSGRAYPLFENGSGPCSFEQWRNIERDYTGSLGMFQCILQKQ